MTNTEMTIRSYLNGDENAVVELWRKCNLLRSWNNSKRDIECKVRVGSELYLVGIVNDKAVATVMGGYEGHRGWVYYLAVDPSYQRRGLGRQIMKAVEKKLLAMDCLKINLLIRMDNLVAVKFYQSIGYKIDEVVSMEKRLVED